MAHFNIITVSCETHGHAKRIGYLAPEREVFEFIDISKILDVAKQRGWVFSETQDLYARTHVHDGAHWPALCGPCAVILALEKANS